ncbi:MAG: hypothetical protein GY710_08465 [Desulfobacteraceae bacterium]|nr:hypothetical protein [Desulfobacteraceae bacterium]
MAEITGEVKAQLILTVADVVINKGLPALAKMISELNKKDVVTVEDIKSLKGELDSATYFD